MEYVELIMGYIIIGGMLVVIIDELYTIGSKEDQDDEN